MAEMKDPYGRRGRLLTDIEEYDFIIQHIDGTENTLADALSHFGFDKHEEKMSSTKPAQHKASQTEDFEGNTSAQNDKTETNSQVFSQPR